MILADVLDVLLQVDCTGLERIQVFLAQFLFRHTAVVLECTDGCHEDNAVRMQAGLAALDVEEFFCAQVCTEACLGYRIVSQLQGKAGCSNRVAAMCNVGERAAMHQARGTGQGLHQVRLDGILQQGAHGTVNLQVTGKYRGTVIAVCNQNIAAALFQVRQAGGQAKDCHHLAGNGNHVMIFTWNTVDGTAHAHNNITQGTVIHIHNAGEDNAARVNFQRIALLHMVVNHRAQQVVCRTDGVDVTGEMQVDILHWDNLCIAAACSTALDAEYRTQGRLTQGNDGAFAHLVQCLTQTNGCGGLAFTCRSRVDCGYQNQAAIRLVLQTLPCVIGNLCLILTVVFQLILQKSGLFGHLADWQHGTVLRNFDITQHIKNSFLLSECMNGCHYSIIS